MTRSLPAVWGFQALVVPGTVEECRRGARVTLGGGDGTHRRAAWGWPPPRTARCTASQPAWCSAARGSGRAAGGGKAAGEGGRGADVGEGEGLEGRRRPETQGAVRGTRNGERGRQEQTPGLPGAPPHAHGAPRPTVTRAAPQARSSGSRRCARFACSWTPVRIFTVSGTSSTCGRGPHGRVDNLGQSGEAKVGAARGGRYLAHASDDLLELGRAVHEGAAPTLGEKCGGALVDLAPLDHPSPSPVHPQMPRGGKGTFLVTHGHWTPPALPCHWCDWRPPWGPDGETEAGAQRSVARGHYLLVHEVDGAADIDVHKVHLDGAVQQLCTLGHGVGEAAFQLRARGWSQAALSLWVSHQRLPPPAQPPQEALACLRPSAVDATRSWAGLAR